MAEVCVSAAHSVACVKVLTCSIVGLSGTYTLHEAERYGEVTEDKEDLCPLDLVFATIRKFPFQLQTGQQKGSTNI